MDLRQLRATIGLSARGTGTRAGCDWDPVLGVVAEHVEWPGVEEPVIFQVRFTGITFSVNPALSLVNGAVTANGATVSGGGVDFEGRALPTFSMIHAILFQRLDADAHAVIADWAGASTTAWYIGAEQTLLHVDRNPGIGELGDNAGASNNLVFSATSGTPAGTVDLVVTVVASQYIEA